MLQFKLFFNFPGQHAQTSTVAACLLTSTLEHPIPARKYGSYVLYLNPLLAMPVVVRVWGFYRRLSVCLFFRHNIS